MLFNEPKLLKKRQHCSECRNHRGFSALQRAEIAENHVISCKKHDYQRVSVLFNEPKLLKTDEDVLALLNSEEVSVLFNEPKLLKSVPPVARVTLIAAVSVLFNEPKLLKTTASPYPPPLRHSFSALQRAEIAENEDQLRKSPRYSIVSVLFNEPKLLKTGCMETEASAFRVSVLFNEPKLLKRSYVRCIRFFEYRVSVLFNEPKLLKTIGTELTDNEFTVFQCSSTSRNC